MITVIHWSAVLIDQCYCLDVAGLTTDKCTRIFQLLLQQKKQLPTLSRFNLNAFFAHKRQQGHGGVDRFAYELDVRWIGRVDLETSKQRPLSERKRMITQECIVITQQSILHFKRRQSQLML